MKLIDMHCDTLMKLLEQPEKSLAELDAEVNLPGLKQAGSMAQFFACFTNLMDYPQPPERAYDEAYRTVLRMIERMKEEIEKAPQELALATGAQEILDNDAAGKISAFLTVEEGGILNGRMERLHDLYDQGIRLITLTWNYENCLGSPNSRTPAVMERGLKKFGLETVERMNELGMLIDVSHLSDGGFWDCIRKSRTPVVASHSNARALCAHPRNLSDDMLRALGNKGGVAGLNFYSPFLRVSQHGDAPKAELDDLVRHAVWIVDRAGEDAAALGTDFDGFEQEALPRGICGVQDIGKLWEAFRRGGLTPRQIEKIAWRNVRRVLREVCR